MLSFLSSAKIFLVSGSTDMRKAFDTLAAIVSNELQTSPYSGCLFVFCNRARNRIKILVWEDSGFWLCAKRLESGTFTWPHSDEKSISMTPQELTMLLGGIDLKATVKRKWYRRPVEKLSKTLL